MKPILLLSLSFAFITLSATPASAEDFFIFKAAVSMPVEYVLLDVKPGLDQVVKKNLTSKEVVNLTLGRPIDTTLDPATEILAFQIAYEQSANQGTPMGAPKTKLIVWDSTATGMARVKATVMLLTTLDYDECYIASGIKGQGIATGTIAEGTADPNGKNKFFATTLQGAAHVSGPQNNLGTFTSLSVTLNAIAGRIHFKYTDTKNVTPVDVAGISSKGSAKTIGKVLATYVE